MGETEEACHVVNLSLPCTFLPKLYNLTSEVFSREVFLFPFRPCFSCHFVIFTFRRFFPLPQNLTVNLVSRKTIFLFLVVSVSAPPPPHPSTLTIPCEQTPITVLAGLATKILLVPVWRYQTCSFHRQTRNMLAACVLLSSAASSDVVLTRT